MQPKSKNPHSLKGDEMSFLCAGRICAFFALVIIVDKNGYARGSPGIHEIGGYSYPVPQPPPPPQFDEPASPPTPIYIPPPPFQEDDFPQIIPTYLPPNIYPPIGNPPLQDEIQPPYDDNFVISSPPSNQYLPPGATTRQSPLQVVNMSCLESRDGSGFFRTTLRSASNARTFPVMESSSSDCVIAPSSSESFRIDLEGQRMIGCGVRSCGTRMCLTLRMANIRGLRLADDPLVTLQCIPQEAVVSHVKHLRINTQSDLGRSNLRSVAIASGGHQRRFETSMSLLRRGSNSDVFDQPVQQGGAVRIGDELLLRTAVRDGDGWTASRLGSVIIRSAASQRSVTLVDENGCRVPSMRSILPQQPQQVTPLIIQMPFRAFLFQGAAPADDLLLSVRMVGCLRARDCYQSKSCDQDNGRSRVTRQANLTESNKGGDNERFTDFTESEFQFRVLPRDVAVQFTGAETRNDNNVGTTVIIVLGTFCAVLLFALVFLMKPLKRQLYY